MIETIEKTSIFEKIHAETERLKGILKEFSSMDEAEYEAEDAPFLLHTAAKRFYFSVAEFLIQQGYDVNGRDSVGNTPLIEALSAGDRALKMVRFLVEHGADPTIQNNKGTDAIQKAEGSRFMDIAEYMREKAGRLNLFDMIRLGNIDEIKKFVKKTPEAVNQDFYSHLPLQEAIRLDQLDIAEYLIKAKADVNGIDGHQRTPLYIAAMTEKPEAIKLLIANGAKINRKAQNGYTLLDHTESHVSPKIISLLKELGAVKWAHIAKAAPDTL